MQPGRARTSGLEVPLLPLARWVGWVAPVRPTRGLLVLSCPSAALRVCGVLGHLAPVHRCARVVCCVAFAVSLATWLLFTGAPARYVVLCVWCPGPPGSRSPVCPLGVLCCVCGVLGDLAPVHRCARSGGSFACAVSGATWLLFTGVPAPSFVLLVRCPRPLGSCSPVCPLGEPLCVCGVLGHLAPVHRCARLWCPVPLLPSVHVRVRCPRRRGACSPVCALCAVRACCWCLCPSSPPPNFLFCFFSLSCLLFLSFLFSLKWKKRGRVYTAGTGMGNWCSAAIALCSLAFVASALMAVAPPGCGLRVLMHTGMAQGGFG